MALKVPKLDAREYREILDEALARIRVHTPEWTNFNESDPGVTLLELFAFMTDSLNYRANLIPERNRRKFLTLLGIPLEAAAAARGIVTFANERGPLSVYTLGSDLAVKAGPVNFCTENGLDVLPVELRAYYRKPDTPTPELQRLYDQYYKPHRPVGVTPQFYKTVRLMPPINGTDFTAVKLSETVDHCLWLALLARPKDNLDAVRQTIGGKVLSLGVLPAWQQQERVLGPHRSAESRNQTPLLFERPNVLPGKPASYVLLPTTMRSDVLEEPGLVAITLPEAAQLTTWSVGDPLVKGTGAYPPALEDPDEEARVLTWIRVRLPSKGGTVSPDAAISWVGANACAVTQRIRVHDERLGEGTGEPDQTYILANKPVIPGSVQLMVGGERWNETDDLMAAGPEAVVRDRRLPPGTPQPEPAPSKLFAVDREAGEIKFGDGLRGMRPPRGAQLLVTYDYGGGQQGNVDVGAINKGPALPPGVTVANPIPTWGGDEAETPAEAERNIARYWKHRDRLVTAADWKEIVERTPGVDLGRVEILPLFRPGTAGAVDGAVTVMVVPRYSEQGHPPMPDRLFLDQVCRHVEPRRLVTTEVHIHGPGYLPICVSVGIELVPGFDLPVVREAVNAALIKFLSPLMGGREETGWPLNRTVTARELMAEVARVDGVSAVNNLHLGEESGGDVPEIRLTGLCLPWLSRVDTRQGDAAPLDELRGVAEPQGGDAAGTELTPVPSIPPECRG
ncbi:MAG: putative baseplate assembly protein [Mycobacterium leprae]